MQPRQGSRFRSTARALALVAVIIGLVGAAVTGPAQGAVNLGTAEDFAVLAATAITNTGPTTINGDVGLYPGTSVTGFTTVILNGDLHVTDAVAQQALIDATAAYDALRSRTPCTDLTGEVLGQTVGTAADPLEPGVYCFSSSAQVTGDLYLTGGGEYVFQIGSTLTTASNSRVIVQSGNAADACNIFWTVGSSATLGTNSLMVGTIIANTSITANTGAVVEGRLFALEGAVTLDANTIDRPLCDTTPTTAPTTTSTTILPTTTTSTTISPTTTTSTTISPTTTTSTTISPTTTTSTTAPSPTTTTVSPTTTVPSPTTSAPVQTTTTQASSATTTTLVATTTTRVAAGTSTTVAAGTTTSLRTGTTTTTSVAGGAAGGEALARTGSTVRWLQFWAGIALAAGGVLVRVAHAGATPVRRRRSDS